MKKFLFALIIIILFLVFVIHSNTNPKSIILGLAKKGIMQQQELTYRVYLFGILPVGEAILRAEKIEEYNSKKALHLSAVAESLKVFSKLFKGEAILDSYIDMQGFNPFIFRQKIIITGKPNIEKEAIYDQKNGIMYIAGERRRIFPNTQDPLSAIFNIRRADFDKIKELQMNINTNQKNYILKGIASQQEISVNNKIYKIILAKANIRRHDKNPYHQSHISIVLLRRGESNIPILIKVFASGFLINARLIDIK